MNLPSLYCPTRINLGVICVSHFVAVFRCDPEQKAARNTNRRTPIQGQPVT